MDKQLLQAYRATDYRVKAAAPFTLRIDQGSGTCDALMDAHRVTTGAFITAWNPYSQKRSDTENAVAQAQLSDDLAGVCVAALPGEGAGQIGDWPPEPSFFALGISRDDAIGLARKYRQNAFVWIEHGKVAELVICA